MPQIASRDAPIELANDRSLAWGIARAVASEGAELAFSYQGEALEKRVKPLAAELGSDLLVDCDVSDMKALDKTFDARGENSRLKEQLIKAREQAVAEFDSPYLADLPACRAFLRNLAGLDGRSA